MAGESTPEAAPNSATPTPHRRPTRDARRAHRRAVRCPDGVRRAGRARRGDGRPGRGDPLRHWRWRRIGSEQGSGRRGRRWRRQRQRQRLGLHRDQGGPHPLRPGRAPRAHAHAQRRDDAERPGDDAAATRRAPAEPVALELSEPSALNGRASWLVARAWLRGGATSTPPLAPTCPCAGHDVARARSAGDVLAPRRRFDGAPFLARWAPVQAGAGTVAPEAPARR
jgi:hypothetical protein